MEQTVPNGRAAGASPGSGDKNSNQLGLPPRAQVVPVPVESVHSSDAENVPMGDMTLTPSNVR